MKQTYLIITYLLSIFSLGYSDYYISTNYYYIISTNHICKYCKPNIDIKISEIEIYSDSLIKDISKQDDLSKYIYKLLNNIISNEQIKTDLKFNFNLNDSAYIVDINCLNDSTKYLFDKYNLYGLHNYKFHNFIKNTLTFDIKYNINGQKDYKDKEYFKTVSTTKIIVRIVQITLSLLTLYLTFKLF